MSRFYFNPEKVSCGVVLLEEKESRHALRVLRLKAGDTLELLDGRGKSFMGFVIGEEGGLLKVQLDANGVTQRAPVVPMALACSVIKPDGMEWMIQKACELGVAGIFPILSERSVVKLPEDKWQARTARWQRIAEEACKQCGLTVVPRVSVVQKFKNFMEAKKGYEKLLMPTLAVKGQTLSSALKTPAKSVLVMIGPEGDFTSKETEEAVRQGAVPISLGPLVMRSETAAVFSLSALRFHYDEI